MLRVLVSTGLFGSAYKHVVVVSFRPILVIHSCSRLGTVWLLPVRVLLRNLFFGSGFLAVGLPFYLTLIYIHRLALWQIVIGKFKCPRSGPNPVFRTNNGE